MLLDPHKPGLGSPPNQARFDSPPKPGLGDPKIRSGLSYVSVGVPKPGLELPSAEGP